MTKNFVLVGGYIFCPDDVLYVIRHDRRDWNANHSEMIWYSRLRFNGGEGLIFEETYFDQIAEKLVKNKKDNKNDTSKG